MNITCQRIVGLLSIRIIEEIKNYKVKPYKPALNLHYTPVMLNAFSQYRMCDRSRQKFRLSQCRTKHALKGLVVRIPRDKVFFSVKAWVLELPGVYLLIGVDWDGFQSLTSNIYGTNLGLLDSDDETRVGV